MFINCEILICFSLLIGILFGIILGIIIHCLATN